MCGHAGSAVLPVVVAFVFVAGSFVGVGSSSEGGLLHALRAVAARRAKRVKLAVRIAGFSSTGQRAFAGMPSFCPAFTPCLRHHPALTSRT